MAEPQAEAGGKGTPPQRITPCPKCGAVDWYWHAKRRHWRCRPCDAQRLRRSPNLHGHGDLEIRHCSDCGRRRRVGERRCPVCQERGRQQLGECRLRERYPATYVTLILKHFDLYERAAFLRRLAYTKPTLTVRRPRASTLFPSISPGLDERLMRDDRDTDVACLEALAALPRHEQAPFYDRYLQHPGQALRWASLPPWKRPLMAAEPEDRLIWKIFTILRLKAQWCARFNEQGLAEEGYQLAQLAGLLESIKEPRRLGMVLAIYGGMLRAGVDPGDVMHPPWPIDYGAPNGKPGEDRPNRPEV